MGNMLEVMLSLGGRRKGKRGMEEGKKTGVGEGHNKEEGYCPYVTHGIRTAGSGQQHLSLGRQV